MNPKLSIILVTYKSEDNLGKLLDTIKKSAGQVTHEVIVVDNYPADKSVSIAKKHPTKPQVYPQTANLGFSKGVNIALKYVKGEYVLLLNPDTLPKGKAIEKLVGFAEKHPGLGAVAPKLLDYTGKTQPSCYRFPTIINAIRQYFLGHKNYFNKYYPGNKTTKVEIAVMAAFLLPMEVIKKVGGLDEKYFLYYEDIEYCRRLSRFNLPIYFYPQAQVKHAHGASGNFKSHLSSPLAKSAEIYHGKLGSKTLNFVLWIGQKWQKILSLFK